MSQQSAIKRPRKKLWQFSIANLLVAISLVALTCGAFRLDINLGVCVLHLTIAIAMAVVRTRAAVQHSEELWNALDCPDAVRNMEGMRLAITSLGIAFVAVFLFYLGIAISLVLIAITLDFFIQFTKDSNLIRTIVALVFAVTVLGTGIVFGGAWLKWTWPKSYFARPAAPTDPSAKTI
ncbi:MAG: hypothetical protein ACR2FY_14335 [Pirellulaceae bacterium]